MEEGLIMPTIRLPGGHRLTGVPDVRPREDFTPSFTEAFWATILPNPVKVWTDKSGETAMYFGLNASAATLAAAYYGGETLTVYRYMRGAQIIGSTVSLMPTVVSQLPSAAPAAAGIGLQLALLDVAQQSTLNSAQGKPAAHGILPLPIALFLQDLL